MGAQQLSIANFINVSVATLQQGLSVFNTSNLAIFTRDANASTFGTAGFKIYLSPSQVGVDFGTNSNTYAMAVAIFSQQPNILAGGGYLVIIPLLATAQNQQISVTFPGVPVSGTWELSYNSNATSALAYNESASALQTAPLFNWCRDLVPATATGSVAAGFAINSMVQEWCGSPFHHRIQLACGFPWKHHHARHYGHGSRFNRGNHGPSYHPARNRWCNTSA